MQACELSHGILHSCNVSDGIPVQVEGRNVGKVDTETYRIYARAWGALYILPTLLLLLAIAERTSFGFQNWWLSVWSNANSEVVSLLQT